MARKQRLPTAPLSTRPDHNRKFYGAKLAEVFRTPLYDCSLKNVSGVPDFALTRFDEAKVFAAGDSCLRNSLPRRVRPLTRSNVQLS
jgi:hypothetical protein